MKIKQETYKLMDRDTKVLVRELISWISRRESINLSREKEETLLSPKDKPQPGKFKRMDNSILIATIEKISELVLKAQGEEEPRSPGPSLENI